MGVFTDAPIGFAPPLLREASRREAAEAQMRRRAAAAAALPREAFETPRREEAPAAPETAAELSAPPAVADPPAAPEDEIPVWMRGKAARFAPSTPRRRLIGRTAENMPVRRKVADLLGLPALCSSGPCRRARRCVGVRGAWCLAQNRALLEPALAALRNMPRSEDDE